MGNITTRLSKNLKEVKYTISRTNLAYGISQRKGDRLIALFFMSCCANFSLVHSLIAQEYLCNKKEDEACLNYL